MFLKRRKKGFKPQKPVKVRAEPRYEEYYVKTQDGREIHIKKEVKESFRIPWYRVKLFKPLKKEHNIRKAYYPGCSEDITPALVFDEVILLDIDEKAIKKFNEVIKSVKKIFKVVGKLSISRIVEYFDLYPYLKDELEVKKVLEFIKEHPEIKEKLNDRAVIRIIKYIKKHPDLKDKILNAKIMKGDARKFNPGDAELLILIGFYEKEVLEKFKGKYIICSYALAAPEVLKLEWYELIGELTEDGVKRRELKEPRPIKVGERIKYSGLWLFKKK